jgi:hypothetical protein
VKKLTMVVAVAVAALIGSAATARAESGAMIGGGRLALNYSTLITSTTSSYTGTTRTYTAGDGGFGFEGGLVGRLAVVEGQMGVHIGANFIYRSVYNNEYYYLYAFNTSEMAVGVPILFEINPFVVSGLNSSIYEMIFLQIGLQVDYTFSYSETYNDRTLEKDDTWFEREKVGAGLVIGAVGYFNSHASLDVRYYYAFTSFDKKYAKNWSPYSYNIGLSFYL